MFPFSSSDVRSHSFETTDTSPELCLFFNAWLPNSRSITTEPSLTGNNKTTAGRYGWRVSKLEPVRRGACTPSSIRCHNGAPSQGYRGVLEEHRQVDAQGGEKRRGGGPLTRIAPESVGAGGVVLVSMTVDSFLLGPPHPTQDETFQKGAHECAAQDGHGKASIWRGQREIYGQRGRLHERLHEENGLTGRARLALTGSQQEARCGCVSSRRQACEDLSSELNIPSNPALIASSWRLTPLHAANGAPNHQRPGHIRWVDGRCGFFFLSPGFTSDHHLVNAPAQYVQFSYRHPLCDRGNGKKDPFDGLPAC